MALASSSLPVPVSASVITSYSIHYTKLYDSGAGLAEDPEEDAAEEHPGHLPVQDDVELRERNNFV